MKKVISLLLCMVIAFMMTACGGSGEAIDLAEEDPETKGMSTDAGTSIEVTSAKESLNPLTGKKDLANDAVGMRPYAISVNNISSSLPQKGILNADITYEIEAEGGITRMMCMFADSREIEMIGSVRSLRDQFIEALYPLNPIIVHIGTSVIADRVLNENSFRTIDANEVRSALFFDKVKNQSYDTEHCYFTSATLIEKGIEILGIKKTTSSSIPAFNFAKEGEYAEPGTGTASSVYFEFSKGSYGYDGDLRYDATAKKYLKFQHGKEQIDAQADNKQLSYDNVIVLVADIVPAKGVDPKDGLVTVNYQNGGTGYYLCQGRYEEIKWTKGDFSSNFIFTKADGTDLVVN
ncbi:MAG: DUF3048 domain-containing protein, partial [Oscillospiraceae bacterium]